MAIESATQAATFPASWDEPFDDGAAFFFDSMHNPHPMTPLTLSVDGPATAAGFEIAAREQQTPIREFQMRNRNYYSYTRVVLAQPANENEARALAEAAEATARQEIGRLMERWHGEHLPRIKALHRRLRDLDVAVAADDEIPALMAKASTILKEIWTIHFRVAFPMLLAIQLFDEYYADLFGGTTADAHALLVGGVSESVKAGFGLADLAIVARELGLETLFRETDPDALLPALETSAAGRTFLPRLRAYLEEYGLRQDLFEMATPTWQEDPSFALASVRNYLLANRDTREEHAAMARSADAALEAARERLTAYPAAVREQFEAMVQPARQGAFLQEEHNFYIDQQGVALTRLFFLKIGERLAAKGLLAAPDDIFMLYADELREIVAGQGNAEVIQSLVATRRDEFARAWDLTPPPFIGPPPEETSDDNPMERAFTQFWGGPPQEAERPGELKGNAGSRGVASGPARVARTLEEARSLLPGEILVAVTTMPPWTPLFGVAAAVVTETGGPLSHCAIVAREYGIPAVVGVAGATRAIATGQQITVDGERGVVTLAE
jgi:pyruvate,water dikinase